MYGFSGLEGVSGVIQCLSHFGSPIEEKVSDLEGLEGLEGLEMAGFSGLEAWEAWDAGLNVGHGE